MFSLLTVILTLFLTVTDGSSQVLSRYYIGGAYEYDQTPDGSRERLYLGGDAYSASMVYQRDNGGSWTAYNIGRDYRGFYTKTMKWSFYGSCGTVCDKIGHNVAIDTIDCAGRGSCGLRKKIQ